MKRGDWVRIGTTGRKVYRIAAVSSRLGVPIFSLGTLGKQWHPDSAKVVAATRWYTAEELSLVSRP